MESTILQVLFYSAIGGAVSLVGGLLLLSSKERANRLAAYATPFAAGALLAAAFVDLLPEAVHKGEPRSALMWAMIGILLFFLLERFLKWFHHHHENEHKSYDPSAALIIIGDTVHNFIDGIAIAAGFIVSPSTGIVVTLAVAAHEIPQEIGDFGLLINKGMGRKKVLLVNALSAVATVLAAILFFTLGQSIELDLQILLGLVAGFFIYIATSDIIPHIHKSRRTQMALWQSTLLLLGALVVTIATLTLHGYIDNDQHQEVDEYHVQNGV